MKNDFDEDDLAAVQKAEKCYRQQAERTSLVRGGKAEHRRGIKEHEDEDLWAELDAAPPNETRPPSRHQTFKATSRTASIVIDLDKSDDDEKMVQRKVDSSNVDQSETKCKLGRRNVHPPRQSKSTARAIPKETSRTTIEID